MTRFLERETPGIPLGYCQCGCGKKTKIIDWNNAKHGLVRGEPRRFVQGHSSRKAQPLDNYKVDPETGCWIWQGHVARNGYGMAGYQRRVWYAHRLVFTLLRGPIPEGNQLHHECENPSCVNPDHLLPVTPREHGRLTRGPRKTHCVRGHEYSEENTRTSINTRGYLQRNCRPCARLRNLEQRRAA